MKSLSPPSTRSRSLSGRQQLCAAIAWGSIVVSGCARGSVSTGSPSGGSAAVGGATAGAGGSGTGATSLPTIVLPDASLNGNSTPPDDGGGVACVDGSDCACAALSVAVVGKHGIWGDSSDTAFQDWLNSNSAGTAKVDNYITKPAFTSDFLATYNLLILAGLGNDSNNGPWWTFSAAEVAAFQDWIENKGGGVISLAGYSGDPNEIKAKNELLAFSGISYRDPNFSPPCVISKCHYQCGNPSGQINEWNRTDPAIANLSLGIKMIGIDGGHPINVPADAHAAAMSTSSTGVDNWLVGKITGKGRVLVYGDEWITYTSQWSGHSAQYANDPSCKDLTPDVLYQTAQFWYNMIRWTQPNDTCFTIVGPSVTIW